MHASGAYCIPCAERPGIAAWRQGFQVEPDINCTGGWTGECGGAASVAGTCFTEFAQGKQKFLRFLQSHDIFTDVVLAGEGRGASTPEGVADAFRIAVEVSTAGEGAVIVPEFPEGDQKFLHFLHELLRFAT